MRTRLLILGGTTEATALAHALDGDPRLAVVTSLAGRTRSPVLPPGEARIGGFGGVEGLATYLGEAHIDLVIDATHPFAATISGNAAAACAQAGVPRAMLVRPAWERQAGDDWRMVDTMEAAATALLDGIHRVFLTIGRQELAPFARVTESWFLIRTIDQPEPMPAIHHHRLILARGPFALENEFALLREERIDRIVAKHSGGAATYAKLAAARQLGIPVILLKRPSPPDGTILPSVAAAIGWVGDHAGSPG